MIINDHNLHYLNYVIIFYKKVSQYNSAFIDRTEALIKECIRLAPDYQMLYFHLADINIMKKDYESALVNVQYMNGVIIQNQVIG